MTNSAPVQFDNVSVVCKANVYFDGKVVSHSVLFADGSRKTVGLIYPGSFTFHTEAPEMMEIIAGVCQVKVTEGAPWEQYAAGSMFKVPGKSSFEISVSDGITEYVCSFEDE